MSNIKTTNDTKLKLFFKDNEIVTIDDRTLILPDLEFNFNDLLIVKDNHFNIQDILKSYNENCKEIKSDDQIKVINTQISKDVLEEELESVKELLELEPDSKCMWLYLFINFNHY